MNANDLWRRLLGERLGTLTPQFENNWNCNCDAYDHATLFTKMHSHPLLTTKSSNTITWKYSFMCSSKKVLYSESLSKYKSTSSKKNTHAEWLLSKVLQILSCMNVLYIATVYS